jgi:hypothetical protein
MSLLIPLFSAIASFAGAWLAARLALNSFYKERVWERKAAAYTAIFETLHDMQLWYETQIQNEKFGRELSTEQHEALSQSNRVARGSLRKRLDAEMWLIPQSVRGRLLALLLELEERKDHWFDYLSKGHEAIESAKSDITTLVRADLRLDASWTWRSPVTSRKHLEDLSPE